MGESIGKIFEIIAQNILLAFVIFAVVVALIIFLIVFFIVKKVKKNKKKKITQAEETKDGKYSLEDDLTPHGLDGDANASFTKEDIIVSKGQTIVAGKNKDIVIGKYTVLTTIDGVEAFNVRINGFVREITHNSTIILGEGDSICPVSHSIILR